MKSCYKTSNGIQSRKAQSETKRSEDRSPRSRTEHACVKLRAVKNRIKIMDETRKKTFLGFDFSTQRVSKTLFYQLQLDQTLNFFNLTSNLS